MRGVFLCLIYCIWSFIKNMLFPSTLDWELLRRPELSVIENEETHLTASSQKTRDAYPVFG